MLSSSASCSSFCCSIGIYIQTHKVKISGYFEDVVGARLRSVNKKVEISAPDWEYGEKL